MELKYFSPHNFNFIQKNLDSASKNVDFLSHNLFIFLQILTFNLKISQCFLEFRLLNFRIRLFTSEFDYI